MFAWLFKQAFCRWWEQFPASLDRLLLEGCSAVRAKFMTEEQIIIDQRLSAGIAEANHSKVHESDNYNTWYRSQNHW